MLIYHACYIWILLINVSVKAQYCSYFDFALDCEADCVKLNLSCTIKQLGKEFMKSCYDERAVCESHESMTTVCLRKDLPPLGGSQIWPQYSAKFRPNPPGPAKSDRICLMWMIISIVEFSAVIVFVMIPKFIRLYRNWRQSAGRHSPLLSDESPYQPTTEEIEWFACLFL